MRSALSLTQAIAVILLISFLLIVTLKQASITAKHTGDSYIYQRAELFSDSAIKMAIFAIQGYDRDVSGNCLEKITVEGEQFDAEVEILKYYLSADEVFECDSTQTIVSDVNTSQISGIAWMEVKVIPKDKYNDKNIMLKRTTLQKL